MIKAMIAAACVACAPAHAKELTCLAENIYHESRGEPVEGQLAVAHVTLNRVAHPAFPDTICAVVRQPGQFEWVAASPPIREPRAWKRSQWLALQALELYTHGIDESNGALFFQRGKNLQSWHSEHVRRIGNHSFFQ